MTHSKLIYIEGNDDDASLLLDEKGDALHEIDSYHGDKFDDTLMRKLGIKVARINHSKLVREEEYESSGSTCEIPNKDMVIRRVKRLIAANKIKYK